MAKVKTQKVPFDGREIVRVVNFTPKTNKFYSPLPPIMAQALGIEAVEADTLDGAIKAWDEAVERAKAAGTEAHKVIMFRFSVGGHPFEGEPRYGRRGDPNPLKLEIAAGVYTESVTTMGGTKRYAYALEASTIPAPCAVQLWGNKQTYGERDRPSGIIPWSEETEAQVLDYIKRAELFAHELQAFSGLAKAVRA